MAFRIQDLMMDVRPGGARGGYGAMDGYQMANPECTCQITVKPGVQRKPEIPPDGEPDPLPEEAPDDACVDTVLPPGDDPPELDARAGLAMLKAQLRHDLGLGL